MQNTTPMRIAKTGYIILSAVLCIIGISFITYPESASVLIGKVIGITFCSFGVIKIIGYLSRDLYRLAFQYDLAFGILVLALGVISMVHPVNT
ncbi:MAG: DUF308 domain-containing protein, partial [Solobacterium sp.]|nr:DUF308 domain-containing protein [Solobacterium sp.]